MLPLISISETGFIPSPHLNKYGKEYPPVSNDGAYPGAPSNEMRFSRLSLLSKIMLSTSVAVTVLFAITGQIVLRNVTKSMSESLEDEVRAASTPTLHCGTRAPNWCFREPPLGTMSDVRAAFSTGDQATIRDTASELWSRISNSAGIFLVTDPHGRVIASLGGVTPPSLHQDLEMVRGRGTLPAALVGFLSGCGRAVSRLGDAGLRAVEGGQALLNVLVAGNTSTP